MNIQLRDSKPLQAAIMKRMNRNALPHAQANPELIAGYLDIDGGGFVVRSADPLDKQTLSDFLPASAPCDASWIIAGGENNRTPSQLVFAFGDGSKIAIRTQSMADVTKLTSVLPADQRFTFDASHTEGRITIARPSNAPVKTTRQNELSSLPMSELKERAAELGIPWDMKASTQTMVDRVAEGEKKKGEKVAAG